MTTPSSIARLLALCLSILVAFALPAADVYSFPFQDNLGFGYGPNDAVQNVLRFQPVIPIRLGPVNLVTGTIIPILSRPTPAHTWDSLLCRSMPTWSMAGLHSPAALTAFELWGSRATTVEVVGSRFLTST